MLLSSNLNLQKNQILNAIVHRASTAPATTLDSAGGVDGGQVWYDTSNKALKFWNGTAWVTSGLVLVGTTPVAVNIVDGQTVISVANSSADDADTLVLRDALGDFAANQITADLIGNASTATKLVSPRNFSIAGKVIASPVAFDGSANVVLNVAALDLVLQDLIDADVLTIRLNDFAVPDGNINLGGFRVINSASPVDDNDLVNKAYVLSLLSGNKGKYSVRVATETNINIASPGATIDSETMVEDDRVLLNGQTPQLQNGVYLWKGAAVPMVRATDADTWDEIQGWIVEVLEGTYAATYWLNVSSATGVLETDAVLYVSIGGAAVDITIENAETEGTDNVGVFSSKVGDTYKLRNIATTSPALSITNDTTKVSIELDPSEIPINDLDCTTPLTVAHGGTGADNAADARANLSVPGVYHTGFGDGSATQFTITHGLETEYVQVTIRKTGGTKEAVLADWRVISGTQIRIDFGTPTTLNPIPTLNEYTVVVVG